MALSLDESAVALDERAENLVALDEAITRLGELSPRLGQVVECRFLRRSDRREDRRGVGGNDAYGEARLGQGPRVAVPGTDGVTGGGREGDRAGPVRRPVD